jgi:hypothetical protein
MKSHLLLGLLCSVSVALPTALPAKAQSFSQPQQAYSATTVIPQSTAITVAFPAQMLIDAKKEQDYPTTLMLAQPLFDANGNQLAPQNSPVAARIRPTKDGAQIIAESLIIQGRSVPIQASSPILPSRKVTIKSGVDQAKALSPIGGRIGGGLLGGIGGGNFADFDQGAMLGSGIGAIAGLASAKSVHVVEISQGSVYVLTLQTPVAIALPTPVAAPVPTPAAAANNPQFQFRTVQEYEAGLNKILQAYQQRQLSPEQTLNIIKAANTYATTQLQAPLYPPVAQRQLIRQVFSFSYAIDSQPQGTVTASKPEPLF